MELTEEERNFLIDSIDANYMEHSYSWSPERKRFAYDLIKKLMPSKTNPFFWMDVEFKNG